MFVVLVISCILIIVLLPFVYWYYQMFKYRSLGKIPGPKPTPLLGNYFGTDPTELYKTIHELGETYGDIFKFYTGPTIHVAFSNPKHLEAIFSSTVHTKKSDSYEMLKPWLGEGLLISTGTKWKTRRKMITPTFHFNILERFVEIFNTNSKILVNELSKEVGKPSTDLYPFIKLFALDVICETSMGTKIRAQNMENAEYVTAVRTFLEIFIERFFSSWKRIDTLFKLFSKDYTNYQLSLKILHKFSNDIIERKRREISQRKRSVSSMEDDMGIKKKVSLIDMLLENEDLTDEDIREEINTFMFEGHDTTSSGLSFALLAIAENPTVQQKIYEEIVTTIGTEVQDLTSKQLNDLQYLDLVFKEAQRLYGTVPFVERELTEDFVIDDVKYPAGTTLTIMFTLLHRNKDVFPEPEKFIPERFLPENVSTRHNFAYAPFSAGPRNCIGQKFAVLEMKAAVVHTLQKFELEAVPGYKPHLGTIGVLNSFNGIQVRIKERKVPI